MLASYLLTITYLVLPALASPLPLQPQRRCMSSTKPDTSCFGSMHNISRGSIIAIIVSCVATALIVAALIFCSYRKLKRQPPVPSSSEQTSGGMYNVSATNEMIYAGKHTHLGATKSYTHSSSTLSTTYTPKTVSPPSAETLYGYSAGAI